jgi:hypothetical protein
MSCSTQPRIYTCFDLHSVTISRFFTIKKLQIFCWLQDYVKIFSIYVNKKLKYPLQTYLYLPLIHHNKCFKNTNHQQMHKESFIINRNTLLHVSALRGHLQGELFVIVTLRLHFIVEWECAVDCVLEAWTLYEFLACRSGPQRVHASKNNAVHSQQHILTQL